MKSDKLVSQFLNFLGVEKQEPSLSFLNELINNHQKKVKWETVTKIVDWEDGNKTGNFLPPIEVYIDRITRSGMGGTCWTLAVGFHWLLTCLGFKVHYLYMDSGHLCLRVDLEQPYYVDVGYCAPLFMAYPLHQSFQVNNEREVFDYQVENEEIKITRSPGPTKVLLPKPVTIQEMEPLIDRSNQWETSPVFKDILIFAYVDGVITSINNHVLKQYHSTGIEEKTLTSFELDEFITGKLRMDSSLYQRAIEIYTEKHKLIKQ